MSEKEFHRDREHNYKCGSGMSLILLGEAAQQCSSGGPSRDSNITSRGNGDGNGPSLVDTKDWA